MKIPRSNRRRQLLSIFLCLATPGTATPKQNGGLNVDWPKSPINVPSAGHILPLPVRAAPDAWVPPDVDTFRPPVAEGIDCPLGEIVSEAGARVEEFWNNLNQVTATETIQHQTVKRSGTLGSPEIAKYEYVASVDRMRNGTVNFDEYRRPVGDTFRSATDGSNDVSVANAFIHLLVFLPRYAGNFRLTCEGLGTWRGQPAWQIHFEERPDRAASMNVLILHGKRYSPRIRGRAWVLTGSYQVIRVETDLVDPILEARLRLWHQVIEYSPRAVPTGGQEAWLPSTSEFYMEFRRHRFYRRHSYNNFHLFLVNVHQKFGAIL